MLATIKVQFQNKERLMCVLSNVSWMLQCRSMYGFTHAIQLCTNFLEGTTSYHLEWLPG